MTDSAALQRVDKWLWYARQFKSRSLAAKFVEGGTVRLQSNQTKTRLSKPSQTVKQGDILTFTKGTHIRVLKVVETGKRRGPAVEAQTLYEDLSPPPPSKDERAKETDTPARPKGMGRPTKRDRRALDAWQNQNDD